MTRFLRLCAAWSRLLLVLGLLAGVGLPGLAAAMEPWLPQMVAVLLVVTAFRIGHRAAFGALTDLRWSLPAVAVLQMIVPLAMFGLFAALGLTGTPLALAVVLACAAPTLSGAASLAIILRQSPARMMQILVLGTALFPLTILPILAAVPQITDPAILISAAVRGLGIILGSTTIGFLLRASLLPQPDSQQVRAMDGAAVLFFSMIVVALMAALGPMLRSDPLSALGWTLAAFALCFGLQALTLLILRRSPVAHVAGPIALAAGNRNIALFLVSLPVEIVGPIMIFVACWQLPMYLTPFALPRLYGMVPAHE